MPKIRNGSNTRIIPNKHMKHLRLVGTDYRTAYCFSCFRRYLYRALVWLPDGTRVCSNCYDQKTGR